MITTGSRQGGWFSILWLILLGGCRSASGGVGVGGEPDRSHEGTARTESSKLEPVTDGDQDAQAKYKGVAPELLGFTYWECVGELRLYVRDLARQRLAEGKAHAVSVTPDAPLVLPHAVVPDANTTYVLMRTQEGSLALVFVRSSDLQKWPRYAELQWLDRNRRPVQTSRDVPRKSGH